MALTTLSRVSAKLHFEAEDHGSSQRNICTTMYNAGHAPCGKTFKTCERHGTGGCLRRQVANMEKVVGLRSTDTLMGTQHRPQPCRRKGWYACGRPEDLSRMPRRRGGRSSIAGSLISSVAQHLTVPNTWDAPRTPLHKAYIDAC